MLLLVMGDALLGLDVLILLEGVSVTFGVIPSAAAGPHPKALVHEGILVVQNLQ